MSDHDHMRQAIATGKRNPRAPIGCVLVNHGRLLVSAHNEVESSANPTYHAEMVAIRRVCDAGDAALLRGATLYSTLQPCGMCSMACIWAKIGRIVYGAERHQVHKMYFEDRHYDTMDFIRDAFRADMEIRGGLMAAACAALYHGPDDDVPESEQANTA